MSTQQNIPDDETPQVEEVAEIPSAALPEEPAQVAPTDETEPIATVDETEPIEAAPELLSSEENTDVDQTAVLDLPEPAVVEAAVDDEPAVADTHPFDVFAAAARQQGPTPYGSPESGIYSAPAPAVLVDTPAAEHAPATESAVTTEPVRRRLRVGTVVWGLILAAFGLGVVAWASGARIDLQLALIVLLAVAGGALLIGSILSGARHARR